MFCVPVHDMCGQLCAYVHMWYVRVLCVHVPSGYTSSALPLSDGPGAANASLGLLDLARYFVVVVALALASRLDEVLGHKNFHLDLPTAH